LHHYKRKHSSWSTNKLHCRTKLWNASQQQATYCGSSEHHHFARVKVVRWWFWWIESCSILL